MDWINHSLIVSPHPSLNQNSAKIVYQFDIVINVSDLLDIEQDKKLTDRGIQSFWFPMGESFGFPLENIYGAMSVLWLAERDNKKVLLHCIAGRNRSVAVADCYYFLRTGEHRQDRGGNQLLQNIKDNQLPGIYRMELFLENCKKLFLNPNIADQAYVDWLKRESIYN